MASAVVTALGEVFVTGALSDCDVVFCLEEGSPAETAGAPADPAHAASVPAVVGEPLPGHSLVLCLASERFRAQVGVERWADDAAETSSSTASRRPQLRVPLGSEAEAPFARAAIGYAYTGQVAAVGVSEVLEVRRQAGYLQISGCAAACDELLMGMLAVADGEGNGQQAAAAATATAAATAVAGTSSFPAAAAELVACWALLPDPVDDPSFAPILAAAEGALLRHFGDVLAVLNTPPLRQQLLQLPAAVVEALLGSEAFGTDTEDSVLLLLATWMKANHSQTDAATRARLCRLVRLVQLSRPYLTAVLLALAADYETGAGGSPCAWLPISVAEAGFITALATAPAGREKEATLRVGEQLYITQSPWYSASPRPQCLSAEGRTFEWAISQQELRAALRQLQPKDAVRMLGPFEGGDRPCARGFEWKVVCQVQHKATSAGCFLECAMPAAYDVPGSRLGSGSKVAAVVGLDACLAVRSWGHGAYFHDFVAAWPSFCAGRVLKVEAAGDDSPLVLPLAQPQPTYDGSGGCFRLLAGWAALMRNGRLAGTLTVLPPFTAVMRSEDAECEEST
ncbi:hypothetical protein TSOC_013831 [Tetrabaena socialis]|uniref:BACK domain-containing protein n=1 Tax=Tetrabaena socialis TaxID=47790 RepID=A0A2J7ZJA5_9CHLO|nr:hypothetical protein TSOC_013831 [Tetrabaena socialis]|eukprot:PNH00352.1 hypothetical protein TSOC_013831 [Tetrabaena socialis]